MVDPDQKITGEDVIIKRFPNEQDLLIGYKDLIQEENPNIIVGYNILGFDIPYMIARSTLHGYSVNTEFEKQGFHKTARANQKRLSNGLLLLTKIKNLNF